MSIEEQKTKAMTHEEAAAETEQRMLHYAQRAKSYWEQTYRIGQDDKKFYGAAIIGGHGDQTDEETRAREVQKKIPRRRIPLLEQYVNLITNNVLKDEIDVVLAPSVLAGENDKFRSQLRKFSALMSIVKNESTPMTAHTKVLRDLLTGGIGFYRLRDVEGHPIKEEKHLLIEPVVDPFLVAIDPSDAANNFKRIDWAMEHDFMTVSEIKRRWGDYLLEGADLNQLNPMVDVTMVPEEKKIPAASAAGQPRNYTGGASRMDSIHTTLQSLFYAPMKGRSDNASVRRDGNNERFEDFHAREIYILWEMIDTPCWIVRNQGIAMQIIWDEAMAKEMHGYLAGEGGGGLTVKESTSLRPHQWLFVNDTCVSKAAPWKGDRIPLFPVVGPHKEEGDEKGTALRHPVHTSFINGIRHIQEDANTTRSAQRALLSKVMDTKMFINSGSAADVQRVNQAIKAGHQIIVTEDPRTTAVAINPLAGVQGPLVQNLLANNDDWASASGIDDVMFGQAPPRQTSGKSIEKYQNAGLLSIAHWARYIKLAIKPCYKEVVALLPRVYDYPMPLNILREGYEGTEDETEYTQQEIINVEEMDENGVSMQMNRVAPLRFDINLVSRPLQELGGDQALSNLERVMASMQPEYQIALIPTMLARLGGPGMGKARERLLNIMPPHMLTKQEMKAVRDVFEPPPPDPMQALEVDKLKQEVEKLKGDNKGLKVDILEALTKVAATTVKSGTGENAKEEPVLDENIQERIVQFADKLVEAIDEDLQNMTTEKENTE